MAHGSGTFVIRYSRTGPRLVARELVIEP